MNDIRKPTTVRRTLIGTISVIVLGLWLVSMVLLTRLTMGEVVSDAAQRIEFSVEFVAAYLENLEDPKSSALALRDRLSRQATCLNEANGGMAFVYKDSQTGYDIARSQLAFGYGYTDGLGEGDLWYLEFDSVLDDEGQIEFARRVMEYREGNYAFELRPPDPEARAGYGGDGTYARVTGVEEPGGGIQVQHIMLVRPDGTEELFFEIPERNGEMITVEFKQLNLVSALTPLVWHKGNGEYYNGYGDMEERLEHCRAAQSRVESLNTNSVIGTITGTFGGQGGENLSYVWFYESKPIAMHELRWTYVFTFGLALLLIFWISHRLTVRMARPLERLCNQVEYGRPCEPDTRLREVNALAEAFNEAQNKLTNDLRRQQELTRAVAHEIKTPAAVLCATAEALSEGASPERQQEYLSSMVEEADRLAFMVNELLDLSRLEGSSAVLKRQPVDLTALTEGTFERLRPAMKQRALDLRLDLQPVTVGGDSKRLEQVVNNLAVNVLEHAQEGPVNVSLSKQGERAILTVGNAAPPLTGEQLKHLWDPFYKVDESRSGTGSGLGLAVVKNVVTLHGGTCTVRTTPDSIEFHIELPCGVEEG